MKDKDQFDILMEIMINNEPKEWFDCIHPLIIEEEMGYSYFNDEETFLPISSKCLRPNYKSLLRRGDIIELLPTYWDDSSGRYIIYSLPEFDPDVRSTYNLSDKSVRMTYINRIFDHGSEYTLLKIDEKTGLIIGDTRNTLFSTALYKQIDNRNEKEEEFYQKYIVNMESLKHYELGRGYIN